MKPSQRMNEMSEETATEAKSVSDSDASKQIVPVKVNSDVVFKVQLAVSRRKLELAPKNFKGLKNVSMERVGKNFKYLYGETVDYEVSKKLLVEAKTKGFDSAFLVAFKNGVEIDIQEAIK